MVEDIMSAPPTRSTGGNHRNESLRLQLLPALILGHMERTQKLLCMGLFSKN
jgi:hypothetical protein